MRVSFHLFSNKGGGLNCSGIAPHAQTQYGDEIQLNAAKLRKIQGSSRSNDEIFLGDSRHGLVWEESMLLETTSPTTLSSS